MGIARPDRGACRIPRAYVTVVRLHFESRDRREHKKVRRTVIVVQSQAGTLPPNGATTARVVLIQKVARRAAPSDKAGPRIIRNWNTRTTGDDRTPEGVAVSEQMEAVLASFQCKEEVVMRAEFAILTRPVCCGIAFVTSLRIFPRTLLLAALTP